MSDGVGRPMASIEVQRPLAFPVPQGRQRRLGPLLPLLLPRTWPRRPHGPHLSKSFIALPHSLSSHPPFPSLSPPFNRPPQLHHPSDDTLASPRGQTWDVSHSSELFRIHGWGHPYFAINADGHVCVRPLGYSDGSDELDLVELVEALKRRNVKLPMVIRFPDILQNRLQQLHDCFDLARLKYGYEKHFQGVFPIKCNHDRFLLEDIVKFGQQFSFGLEAGSKPELLIAISKLMRSRDALLVCNGYKDKVYIESVLLARKLGINAIVVLEQLNELDLLVNASQMLGVRPVIGVRAKLSTRHSGHWGGTSGDDGKFGLTINEIVRVVYKLREEGMIDCLQLLHFHIGSQIPSISTIKEAMREGSHIYCELVLMGASMGYIDVGGGLGIDYDGTKSQSNASTNYSMQVYAHLSKLFANEVV